MSYEIYASNGRMVYEKQAKCSDSLKITIDDGDYTVESKIGSDSKETQFSVGSDHPKKLTIDMQNISKEPSHEELIKADTQEGSTNHLQEEKPQVDSTPVTSKAENDNNKEVKKIDSMSSDVAEVKNSLAQMGALLGGLQTMQKKPLQAFKQGIVAALPDLKKAKTCYQEAAELAQVKSCEDMEESVLKQAQEAMEKSLGVSGKAKRLKKHTQWNDEEKKATLEQTDKDIKKMELSIVCIDKGAKFKQLNECIANEGEFTAKKSDIEQMGDLFKAFGR